MFAPAPQVRVNRIPKISKRANVMVSQGRLQPGALDKLSRHS